MVRYRKKKAFYEVMKKTLPKSSDNKILGTSQPKETDANPSVSGPEQKKTAWPRHPRALQYNAGRIEISMPYYVAIGIALGLFLMAVVIFRLGQATNLTETASVEIPVESAKPTNFTPAKKPVVPSVKTPPVKKTVAPVKYKGDNRIVIQTHQLRPQLGPVRDYFNGKGIETEIRKIDDWYFLVTKAKYENPERPGTDGFLAKQKIIEIGADYKSPPGYGSFGPKPFSDAYGKKFND
jgi:hypothetical protein